MEIVKIQAKKLVMFRSEIGKSQQEMAEIFGLTQQSWALVEKGKRKINCIELQILVKHHGLSPCWFFSDIGNPIGDCSGISAVRTNDLIVIQETIDELYKRTDPKNWAVYLTVLIHKLQKIGLKVKLPDDL